MVSIADIRQWKPAGLDSAFTALGAHRDTLVTLDDDLARSRNPDGWTGEAAVAAAADLDRLCERMRRIVAGVAGVRRAVGAPRMPSSGCSASWRRPRSWLGATTSRSARTEQ